MDNTMQLGSNTINSWDTSILFGGGVLLHVMLEARREESAK